MRQFFASVLTIFAMAVLAPSAPANAGPAEEAFIRDGANRVFGILGDASLTNSQKRLELREMIDVFVDTNWLGRRVLPPATLRRSDPADVDAFVSAYRLYAISEYEQYLDEYSGETLTVTGSRDASNGRISEVNSFLTLDNGETVGVRWIVRRGAGEERVRDIIVDTSGGSISLLDRQRSDIAALLQDVNGDVAAAAEELRRVAIARSGGPRVQPASYASQ